MTDEFRARRTPEEKIEAAIVAALQDELDAKWKIAAFPDDPDGFDMSNFGKIALVQYVGSRYREPEGVGVGHQMRRAEFAVHITLNSAKLKEAARGPKAIEDVRLALQARRMEGGEIRIIRDGLTDHNGGVWRWIVSVGIDLSAIPMPRMTPAPIIETFEDARGGL